MYKLLEPCCSECWHSAEKPCPDVIDCIVDGPRCHTSEKCAALRRERLAVASGERLERTTIRIGMGTCGMASGAQEVYDAFASEIAAQELDADLVPVGCYGYCEKEVLVDIQRPGFPRVFFANVTPKLAKQLIQHTLVEENCAADLALGYLANNGEKMPEDFADLLRMQDLPYFKRQMKIVLENCGVIDPDSLDGYLARGGYSAEAKALRDMTQEKVIDEMKKSGLRGRGGAGFSTGQKWEFAYKAKGEQKYVVCNADEGDPGAFMDRSILESDPHRIIEGMVIAAYAIGASEGYIYLRAEYPLAVKRMRNSIAKAEEVGLLGDNILGSGFNFHIKMKIGAGAFVCGEETALMASIEGRRGMPRPRPPFPANSGLWGMPTNINNVETLANIPAIIRRGSEWYSGIGTERSKGTKVFALSGNIQNTGLVEVPMGVTVRDVIFEIGGGCPNDKEFKAVQLGGPSGGCIPAQLLDTLIDYDELQKTGAIMGSGGMVVMDEDACMVDVARFFMGFVQEESCGKCIPCREGTKRMLEILDRITMNEQETGHEDQLRRFEGAMLLEKLAMVVRDTSLCGLGQTAPNPVMSTLKYFRDEYEAHIFDRKCPAGVCKGLLHYRIDTELCTGCGLCASKCPENAILGEKRHPYYIIDERCISCDTCRQVCNFGAVIAE